MVAGGICEHCYPAITTECVWLAQASAPEGCMCLCLCRCVHVRTVVGHCVRGGQRMSLPTVAL